MREWLCWLVRGCTTTLPRCEPPTAPAVTLPPPAAVLAAVGAWANRGPVGRCAERSRGMTAWGAGCEKTGLHKISLAFGARLCWVAGGGAVAGETGREVNEMNAEIEIRRMARIAHEVNRAYCMSLGDMSQLVWEDAPDWQKSSAVNGVMAHLKSAGMTPEQSHECWMQQKEAEGWRWGAVKNVDRKEHPCFLPYAELPSDQKVKDYLFRAVVRSLLDEFCEEELVMLGAAR